jgi:hypothetical protein
VIELSGLLPTLGHAGCALPAKISPSCGGPVSVGSFTINRVLARSSISLCATTDRNNRLAIRPNSIKQNPA